MFIQPKSYRFLKIILIDMHGYLTVCILSLSLLFPKYKYYTIPIFFFIQIIIDLLNPISNIKIKLRTLTYIFFNLFGASV